ncbi:MAG TPA: hypothetical protein PKC58_08080 [Ignavibacteria bacterium]|nr:hypothetical protein [Ignavibacteria bacterium]
MNRNYLYIFLVCLFSAIIYLGAEYFFTNGQMGVPLDDTWIHFRFADNFSHGYFYQYNTGEYTAGTTSPLYVIVLGMTSFIIKNYIINSLFLSFLFYLLSCIYIYRTSLLIFKNNSADPVGFSSFKISAENFALLISLVTAITGRVVWSAMSGMETTMFMFFSILGVYYHIKNLKDGKFTIFPALLFALATVSRPEGFLLSALYFFDVIMISLNEKNFKDIFFKFISALLIFGMITFPYLIFSYNISGHFFPNTFRGQGGGTNYFPDLTFLRIAFTLFFRDNLITGLLYVFAFIFYLKRIRYYFSKLRYLNLIFLWVLVLPLVMSVLIPNWRHHVRYMIPLIPFINLITVYLMFYILDLKFAGFLKKYMNNVKRVTAVLLIFSVPYFLVFAVALGKNTDNINSQQVKLAKWVSQNVGRNETIAINDIGAITFLNGNKIIDMAGLVTPEILRYRQYMWKDNLDSLNYLLKKNNVSYIIIYDHWFREYIDKYGYQMEFITSAILDENTICGGREMKVYKTNFNKFKNETLEN